MYIFNFKAHLYSRCFTTMNEDVSSSDTTSSEKISAARGSNINGCNWCRHIERDAGLSYPGKVSVGSKTCGFENYIADLKFEKNYISKRKEDKIMRLCEMIIMMTPRGGFQVDQAQDSKINKRKRTSKQCNKMAKLTGWQRLKILQYSSSWDTWCYHHYITKLLDAHTCEHTFLQYCKRHGPRWIA